MPRVRPPTPGARLSPLPAPSPVRRATWGDQALARGVQQAAAGVVDLAAGVDRYAQQIREEQNRARLQEAFTELGAARQDIASTARQQRGRSALETDLVNQTGTLLDQAAETIAEKLPEDLRADFAQIRRQHALGLRDSVVDHVGRESDTYSLQQHEGALKFATGLGVQGAVAARPGTAADSPEVAEARQTILNAVSARTRDAAPEAAAVERTRALTALHQGSVESLLAAGRAADAQRYLARFGGEMNAEVAAKLGRPVAESSRAAEVESRGAAIIGEATDKAYGYVDPAKALAAVEAIPDDQAELKKGVRQLVEHQVARSEGLRKRAGDEKLNEAIALLEQGVGLTSPRMAPLKAWLLDPKNGAADLWQRLERGERAERRADRTAGAEERRRQRELNQEALYGFDALPPEEKIAVDVAGSFPDVDGPTRAHLRAKQQKAKEGWQKDQGVGETEFQRLVKTEVAGVVTSKKDLTTFLGAVGRERQRWLEENPGKQPPRAEVQRWIVDQLTIGDTRGGSLLSPNKPRFKYPANVPFVAVPEEEQTLLRRRGVGAAPAAAAPPVAPTTTAPGAAKVTSAGQVPAEERRLIEEAYARRNAGRRPSDPELLQRYLAAHPEAR